MADYKTKNFGQLKTYYSAVSAGPTYDLKEERRNEVMRANLAYRNDEVRKSLEKQTRNFVTVRVGYLDADEKNILYQNIHMHSHGKPPTNGRNHGEQHAWKAAQAWYLRKPPQPKIIVSIDVATDRIPCSAAENENRCSEFFAIGGGATIQTEENPMCFQPQRDQIVYAYAGPEPAFGQENEWPVIRDAEAAHAFEINKAEVEAAETQRVTEMLQREDERRKQRMADGTWKEPKIEGVWGDRSRVESLSRERQSKALPLSVSSSSSSASASFASSSRQIQQQQSIPSPTTPLSIQQKFIVPIKDTLNTEMLKLKQLKKEAIPNPKTQISNNIDQQTRQEELIEEINRQVKQGNTSFIQIGKTQQPPKQNNTMFSSTTTTTPEQLINITNHQQRQAQTPAATLKTYQQAQPQKMVGPVETKSPSGLSIVRPNKQQEVRADASQAQPSTSSNSYSTSASSSFQHSSFSNNDRSLFSPPSSPPPPFSSIFRRDTESSPTLLDSATKPTPQKSSETNQKLQEQTKRLPSVLIKQEPLNTNPPQYNLIITGSQNELRQLINPKLQEQTKQLPSILIKQEPLSTNPPQYKLTITGNQNELMQVQALITQQLPGATPKPTAGNHFRG